MSTMIKEFMTATPKTIGHDISVDKARELMRELRCHHLPVLDGGKLVGMLSDRDLALVKRVPNGDATLVEELMTDDAYIVDPDSDVNDAVEKMLAEQTHSVIVRAKDDQPWGIFTATDALKFLVAKNS